MHLPCASGLPAVGLPEGETPKTAKNSVSSPSASPSSAYGLGGSPLADGANVGPLPVLLGRTRAGLGPMLPAAAAAPAAAPLPAAGTPATTALAAAPAPAPAAAPGTAVGAADLNDGERWPLRDAGEPPALPVLLGRARKQQQAAMTVAAATGAGVRGLRTTRCPQAGQDDTHERASDAREAYFARLARISGRNVAFRA